MISISCLESKLLNNNNWYGRFQLAPFQKGEGLTVANALRRTLLAEKSNFFITWVDFYNAEIPYSVLTGMRESIFDILLNLKQVIFTSDKIIPSRSHFLKSSSIKNFKSQKVKFLSKKRFNSESKTNFLASKKSNLNIVPNDFYSRDTARYHNFDNKKTGFHSIASQILPFSARLTRSFSRERPQVERQEEAEHPHFFEKNHGYFKNVFCKNQILGKMINSNHEISSLVPLGILNKGSNLEDQSFDISGQMEKVPVSIRRTPPKPTSWSTPEKTRGLGSAYDSTPSKTMGWEQNSKKMSNSTYIGYICAKGPTIIYAKNIKLPKGLKCVDPDKYIVTLADDGLFYLRFALTTEIKTLSSVNASNISIAINQGLKFNNFRLKTFPKTLFNKEIQSCSSFRIISSISNRKKKLKTKSESQPRFSFGGEQQVAFEEIRRMEMGTFSIPSRSHPRASPLTFLNILESRQAEVPPASKILEGAPPTLADPARGLYQGAWPDHYFKKKHSLLDFGQYTVKNKRKIPFLSQIELHNSKKNPVNHTKNLIKEQRLLLTNDSIKQLNFQNTSIIANIQKTCLLNIQIKHSYYKCGRFDRFLFDLIKPFKPRLKSTYYYQFSLKKKENLFFESSNTKVLDPAGGDFSKTFERQKYANQLFIKSKRCNFSEAERLYLCLHKYKHREKKPFISKLLPTVERAAYFNPKKNLRPCEDFADWLPWEDYNLTLLEDYSIKNKCLLKWQKIFKSIKTTCIYDYFNKLSRSQIALTCLLSTKPRIEKISLLKGRAASKKSISISIRKNFLNNDAFMFSSLHENTEQFFSFVDVPSKIPAGAELDKSYIEKFLSYPPSFHLKRNHRRSLTFCLSSQCCKNHILWFLKFYIIQHNNLLDFLNRNLVRKKNTSLFSKQELSNFLFLKGQSKFLELLSWINKNQKPKYDYHLREFYYSGQTPNELGITHLSFSEKGSIMRKTDFFSSVNNTYKLMGSMVISGHMVSYSSSKPLSLFYKKPHLVNQSWIDLNKYKSLNSVHSSTTLRTKYPKGQTSIRQLSYKPVWILKEEYQQNMNLLKSALSPKQLVALERVRRMEKVTFSIRSWLDHINAATAENPLHAQITKNQFFNVSCLAKKSMKKTPAGKNPIPSNSVILKPTYLNVEQIIYILKQTTKFRKNKRINPVFFNSFKRPNNDKIFPTDRMEKLTFSIHRTLSKATSYFGESADYYLRFSKVSNSLYNYLSKFYNPKEYRIQAPPTTGGAFTPSETIGWDPKQNSISRSPLFYVWIFGSNFLFKTDLSSITVKNQAERKKYSLHSPYSSSSSGENLLVRPLLEFYSMQSNRVEPKPWANRSLLMVSNLLYSSKFFHVPFKIISCFLEASKFYQYALNQVLSCNLTTITYFPRIAITKKHSSFYRNKNMDPTLDQLINDHGLADREVLKINDSYNEPYNINIYNSKISFNLRYTYPFKYTIFETFLPFQSINSYSSKIADMFIFHKPSFLKPAFDSFGGEQLVAHHQRNHIRRMKKVPFSIRPAFPTKLQVPRPRYQIRRMEMLKNKPFQNIKKSDLRPLHRSGKKIKLLAGAYSTMVFDPYFDSIQYNESFKIYTTLAYTCLKTYEPHLSKYHNFNKREQKKSQNSNFRVTNFQQLNFKYLAKAEYNRLYLPGIYHNNSFEHPCFYPGGDLKHGCLDNKLLPSIFDNTYKWRILNNPNFNDAFIIIPCTWSLNFKSNGIGSPIFTEGISPPKTGKINKAMEWNASPSSELSSVIPKFKLRSSGESLKKLAIDFENIYYKNFLWNSRKVTLRILNNAVLPLVANRKYNISNFIPKKNYRISNLINMGRFFSIRHKTFETTNFMCSKTYPISTNQNETQRIVKPNFLMSQAPPVGFQQRANRWDGTQEKEPITNSLPKSQAPPVVSRQAKRWGGTQEHLTYLGDSSSFLHSKWRPFFYGSLRHFYEKDAFSSSSFVHFISQKRKQNENNEKYLLSYNQTTPEKLVSFRKHQWTQKLTHGSKFPQGENSDNISSRTDLVRAV